MARCSLRMVAVLILAITLQAPAQGPKPYGPAVPAETAKKIAAVALAEARKDNWFMAVAVVDPSGTLVYYEKMDNTQTGSADVAIAKARTAALYKRPSKVFQDMVARGGSGLRILRLPQCGSHRRRCTARYGGQNRRRYRRFWRQRRP